ncbi:hypothetical protein ACHAWT_009391 [Skeletonema menzelii]
MSHRVMMNKLSLALAVIATASGCMIQDTNSGVCSHKYLTTSQATLEQIEAAKERWESDLPFCGKYINSYTPCMPEDLNAIREKDRWVQLQATKTVEERIEKERLLGKKHYRYYRNKDCQDSFNAYMCWLNFPRCDEFQESLPLCQSACENMFRVCGFEQDLWRCDEDVIDGNDEWNTRAFFPGQPFRKNEFERGGVPVAVCTPSIRGSASTLVTSFVIYAGVLSLVLLFLLQ